MKRLATLLLVVVVLASFVVACGPAPTPEVVEKVVKETVVVEKEVEKEVEVVVTATPPPPPTPTPELQAKEGGTLYVLFEASAPGIWPLYNRGRETLWIYQLAHDQLLWQESDGMISPRMVESYDISEDGLVYTLNLRNDVKWHDGQPFTAKDVVFTLKLNLTPEATPQDYTRWFDIVGAEEYWNGEGDDIPGLEMVDDYTVRLTLKQRNPSFLIQFANTALTSMVPAHRFEQMKPEDMGKSEEARDFIGLGPFKLVEWVEDDHMTFERFDDYYLGKPHIEKVIARIANVDTGLAMLERGEIDYVMDLPATDYDRIAALPNVKVLERSNDTWPWFIAPNCEGVFADKRLRQALYYALDRQGYVDSVLGGHGRTIPSIPIQPGWALPPDSELNMYEFDPDKAKQLLEEAGWDFDYVVRYFYYPGNKLRDSFAEIAQANLQAIGMKVDVTSMDVQRWIEVSTSGEWDLLQAGAGAFWDPHDWLERYGCDYWFTKGGRGHQRWCNSEWDALMLEAATLTTIEDRAPLYKEAVKIQNEEVPIIWFAAPTYMSAISTRLVGMEEEWDPNTNHLARFRDIHTWMLKQ